MLLEREESQKVLHRILNRSSLVPGATRVCHHGIACQLPRKTKDPLDSAAHPLARLSVRYRFFPWGGIYVAKERTRRSTLGDERQATSLDCLRRGSLDDPSQPLRRREKRSGIGEGVNFTDLGKRGRWLCADEFLRCLLVPLLPRCHELAADLSHKVLFHNALGIASATPNDTLMFTNKRRCQST